MLTKNLTPFLSGVKLTSRRPPQPEMTVVVRATFALRPGEPLAVITGIDQGPLSGELFEEDDEDRKGECLDGGDFADFKLNAEVLLRASCHTPGGKPLTECPVRASVGAWSKVLRVIGPRLYSDTGRGAVASSPLPFTMPITYANSFGGPGYAKNPAGKGASTRELPTIEAPGQAARSPADRLDPAGFGPISPAWPQRSEKVGKNYGKAYKETRAPYYSDDFDWELFQRGAGRPAAPGVLARRRGDLLYEYASRRRLRCRPACPPSASASLPSTPSGRFREVPMALDTLAIRN